MIYSSRPAPVYADGVSATRHGFRVWGTPTAYYAGTYEDPPEGGDVDEIEALELDDGAAVEEILFEEIGPTTARLASYWLERGDVPECVGDWFEREFAHDFLVALSEAS